MTLTSVFLKELRQLLHSRLIWLILVGYPMVMFYFFAPIMYAIEHSPYPRIFFMFCVFGRNPLFTCCMVTSVTAGIVLPLVVSIKTAFECAKNRLGLEFAPSPTQFVIGKLLAAGTLVAVLGVASTPFFVIVYLMQGIHFPSIIAMQLLLVLASLGTTAMGLSIATFLYTPARFLGLLGAATTIFAACVDGFSRYRRWRHLSESPMMVMPTELLGNWIISLWAAIFFSRLAIANISPASENPERPLRQTTLALLVLTLPIGFFWKWDWWIYGWGLVDLFLIWRSCLLFRPMPPTVQAQAPKSFLGRLASFPLATGAYTGPLFVILVLLLIAPSGFCLRRHEDGALLILTLSETIALFLAGIGCLARFRSPRVPAITAVALGSWFVFANYLSASKASREFANMLPCSMFGAWKIREWHLLLTGVLLVLDLFLFLPKLIREFRSYRRP